MKTGGEHVQQSKQNIIHCYVGSHSADKYDDADDGVRG